MAKQKGKGEKKDPVGEGVIGDDLAAFLPQLGFTGLQFREYSMGDLDRLQRMNRPPFNASLFQYVMIPPLDNSITGEDLLARLGFYKERYIQFMQLVVDINKSIIERSEQLARPEKVKYFKFIDSLFSEERMVEIIHNSSATNISILQQLLNDCGFDEEEKNNDLNNEINIINHLVDHVSVVLSFADEVIKGGLSANVGLSDNYKHYSAIILGALLKNILELRIMSSVAIALSKAADYLSPSELYAMTKDVSSEEWQSIAIREDVISPRVLEMLINVIRGKQRAVNHSLMETIHSLREDIEGLKDYLTIDVEQVFKMAVKFSRAEVVKYIISNCLSIISKNLITGAAETIFYYDMKKFMEILFSALIRGGSDTCLAFISPAAWIDYTEQEKLEIVKFIILRSGTSTREILLREIFTNQALGVQKFHLYRDILNNAQSEEEYKLLKEGVSSFIIKYIAARWTSGVVDEGVTKEQIQDGTIHMVIESARDNQEDIILKGLHERKILTLDLYQRVVHSAQEESLKRKVHKLFSYYMDDLYKSKYEENRIENLKGADPVKFISAFVTLSKDERKKYIQDMYSIIKGTINDKDLSDLKKTKILADKRQKLEALISSKLVDSKKQRNLEDMLDSIIQFNENCLLVEEREKPKPKVNKGKAVLPQDENPSGQSSSVANDVEEVVADNLPKKKRNRKKKKKEDPTEDPPQEDPPQEEVQKPDEVKLTQQELDEGWRISNRRSNKKSQEEEVAASNKPGGPSGGSGAIKSSQEGGKQSSSAKAKAKPEPKPKPLPSKPEGAAKKDDTEAKLLVEPVKMDPNSYLAKVLGLQAEDKKGSGSLTPTDGSQELVASSREEDVVTLGSDNKEAEQKEVVALVVEKDPKPQELVVSLKEEDVVRRDDDKADQKKVVALVIEKDSKPQVKKGSISSASVDKPQELVASSKIKGVVTSGGDDKADQIDGASAATSQWINYGANMRYHAVPGPNGVHFYPQQHPVVPLACNAYCVDPINGNIVYFHMDPEGNCIDQGGNHFTVPVYYPISPSNHNQYGNVTNTPYGGGPGGGGSGSKFPKKKSPYKGKGGNHHKASVEEENKQGDFKEIKISLTSSLPVKVVIADERREYKESLKEVHKQLEDIKPHVQLDDSHHFDMKPQNISYVSIYKDEDVMPKLPFSDFPTMFIGVEKFNIDPILM